MSTPDNTPEWKNGYNIGFEAARKRFIKQLYHKELILKWLSKQLARLTHYDCKKCPTYDRASKQCTQEDMLCAKAWLEEAEKHFPLDMKYNHKR